MRIGKRLEKILDLLDDGLQTIIDVGTDHGFLALKAIEEKNTQLVYATDISGASLQKAKDLAKKYNLEDRIKCVVSDGFKDINKKFCADVAIIAGMGAYEIIKILSQAEDLSRFKSFILQPMQDAEVLRMFLLKSGFKIEVDITIKDRNKFYHTIKCEFLGKPLKFAYKDILIGKTDELIKSEDFKDFLNYKITEYEKRSKYLKKQQLEELNIYKTLLNEVKR